MIKSTQETLKKIGLRILLFLVSILIVLTVNYLILIQVFYTNFHTPVQLQSILTNANFSIRSRPAIANFIFSYSFTDKTSNGSFHKLPLDTWESVAEIIFPIKWIQDTTDSIIHSLWIWLNNPTTQLPEISINLSEPLEILRSQQGALAVLPVLQNIPFCENEMASLGTFPIELPECLPTDINYLEASQMIAISFSNSIVQEVDIKILNSQGYITPDAIRTMNNIQNIYLTLNKSRLYALLISIILFLIYCILKIMRKPKKLRSIVSPLFLAGLLSLALIFIGWALMHWGWSLFITFNLIYFDSSIFNLINDLGVQLSSLILKSWFIYTTIFLIVVVILWTLTNLAQPYYENKISIEAELDNKPHRIIKKQFR